MLYPPPPNLIPLLHLWRRRGEDKYRGMCLKRYARIRNSRGDETRLTRTLSPSACVFRRRNRSSALLPRQCPRHPPPSRLNPTYPKPVRGKFQLQFAISWLQRILHFSFPNKRLSFYHEPRNFCSRVPSHLPPSGSRGSAPGIIRYFLRPREIYPCAAPRTRHTQLSGRLHKPANSTLTLSFSTIAFAARSPSHSTPLDHEHFNWSFRTCEFERRCIDFLSPIFAFQFVLLFSSLSPVSLSIPHSNWIVEFIFVCEWNY